MANYENEDEARAAGFTFDHDREGGQFTVSKDGRVVGVAHYTLSGPEPGEVSSTAPGGTPTIDFDHTLVVREHRGTGLSALLATRALTDDIVEGRSVRASCWYIDGFIATHPELLKR